MTVPDGSANDPIHEYDDDELLIQYEEMINILQYGEVDAVTAREKRDFERMQAEIIYRIAEEVLGK